MSPNYDFTLPRALGYSAHVVVSSVALATLIFYAAPTGSVWPFALSAIIAIGGVAYIAIAQYVGFFTNLDRRLLARDLLLQKLELKSNDAVLDVGCGNGILILGAAKMLTNGRAVGTDIWTENSGDNKREIFEQNARIEGVSDRVSLVNEDARKLSFANDTFDVVLCGLTMHHILHGEGADKAIAEMTRVLKPGGAIAIYDVPIAVHASEKLFRKLGLMVNRINSNIIIATKRR